MVQTAAVRSCCRNWRLPATMSARRLPKDVRAPQDAAPLTPRLITAPPLFNAGTGTPVLYNPMPSALTAYARNASVVYFAAFDPRMRGSAARCQQRHNAMLVAHAKPRPLRA